MNPEVGELRTMQSMDRDFDPFLLHVSERMGASSTCGVRDGWRGDGEIPSGTLYCTVDDSGR